MGDSATTIQPPLNLCSLLVLYTDSTPYKHIYSTATASFVGGNVLFEYVFQAQIQNQMQKEGGNYPNFVR